MDTAIAYAKRGWSIFPIQPGKKVPYKGFAWKKKSTNDVEKIKKVIAHPSYKGCNWALDCGKSNVFVVDIDPKKGGFETAQHLPGQLESGFVTRTPSGGYHYYYEGAGPSGVDNMGRGIDTRGVGGYVLIPGSSVDGNPYLFVTDPPETLDPILEWIPPLVGKPRPERPENADIPPGETDAPHNIQAAVKYLETQAPEAVEGQGGDHTTYGVVCRLRDLNLSPATAFELITTHWNGTKAQPPWSAHDLEKKIANAWKYAKGRVGNATLEAMFPDPARSTSAIRCAADVDPDTIKPRPWLLGYRYLPEYVTLTIAPGGVGKSLLTILEGLSIASGKALTRDTVHRQGAVWIYNTEDPFDELDRRVVAAARFHGLNKQDLARFYYSSGYDNPLKLVAADEHNRPVVNTNLVDALIKQIRQRGITLFVVDPFVECHSVNENDNSAIAVVAQTFRKIAKETGCAVSLVHHTSKGKQERGNMDKSRGASALVSAARIAHTVYPMSEAEGKLFGVAPNRLNWYIRIDDAKANLAPPTSETVWYEKHSVRMFPDSEETTGTLSPVVFEAPDFDVAGLTETLFALPFDENLGEISLNAAAQMLIDCGLTGRGGGVDRRSMGRHIEHLFSILPECKTKVNDNGWYIELVTKGRLKVLRRLSTVKTCLKKGEEVKENE